MDNFLVVCYIISIFVVAFILTEIEEKQHKKVKSKNSFMLAFKAFWETLRSHNIMRALCYFMLSVLFFFLFKQFPEETLFSLSVIFVEVSMMFTFIYFWIVFIQTFLEIFDEAKDTMLNTFEGYLHND